MNLESQVTSLEISKKLNELEIKQESLFYWEEVEELDGSSINNIAYIPRGPKVNFVNESFINGGKLKFYSAFTASELLELLPKQWIRIEFHGTKYHCFYHYMKEERLRLEFGNTLPHALSKMLIYLIENNLMEIKK